MIRSLRSREKMSNARSPRAVCSTTIGIRAIGRLLATIARIPLFASWQAATIHPIASAGQTNGERFCADRELVPTGSLRKQIRCRSDSTALVVRLHPLVMIDPRGVRRLGDQTGVAPLSRRDSPYTRQRLLMRGARRDIWGAREASGLDGALGEGTQPLQLLRIVTHAEGEPHLSQDGLDLVQRLLAEVLGLQQLRLGLLYQVGDGPDVGGLEAVGC